MKYYVYELRDSRDHLPFYVGKGKGRRVQQHEKNARNGKDMPCCKRIRSIWEGGGQVEREIIFETDDEVQAYEKEKARIEELGIDNLTNVVRGGGATLPEEVSMSRRKKLSVIAKNRPPELFAKISLAMKGNKYWLGRKHSPESLARMREVKIGHRPSPETCAKMSASGKGRRKSDEWRAMMSARMMGNKYALGNKNALGLHHTPETISKISASSKGHTVSEETRRKISETKKKKYSTKNITSKQE
jgi:hypothetical protein